MPVFPNEYVRLFLDTFDICSTVVIYAHAKSEMPGVADRDCTEIAKGSRSNKIQDAMIEAVRTHIDSFPTIESLLSKR